MQWLGLARIACAALGLSPSANSVLLVLPIIATSYAQAKLCFACSWQQMTPLETWCAEREQRGRAGHHQALLDGHFPAGSHPGWLGVLRDPQASPSEGGGQILRAARCSDPASPALQTRCGTLLRPGGPRGLTGLHQGQRLCCGLQAGKVRCIISRGWLTLCVHTIRP